MINYLTKLKTKKLIEANYFYDKSNPRKFLRTLEDYSSADILVHRAGYLIALPPGRLKQVIRLADEKGVCFNEGT